MIWWTAVKFSWGQLNSRTCFYHCFYIVLLSLPWYISSMNSPFILFLWPNPIHPSPPLTLILSLAVRNKNFSEKKLELSHSILLSFACMALTMISFIYIIIIYISASIHRSQQVLHRQCLVRCRLIRIWKYSLALDFHRSQEHTSKEYIKIITEILCDPLVLKTKLGFLVVQRHSNKTRQ